MAAPASTGSAANCGSASCGSTGDCGAGAAAIRGGNLGIRGTAFGRGFGGCSGGGGFGETAKRDRAAIENDLAEGYISPERANRDYGYRAD